MKKKLVKVLDCFFLLRITLLIPVWTILILGWITGSHVAQPGGWVFQSNFNPGNEHILWIALAGFSLVVSAIYVVNQIVDIESDRINHKLFILPNGLLSVRTAWIIAVLCAVSGLLCGIIFLDRTITLIFILSLIMGVLYDLPPVYLKNRALGGVAANFFGHGVLTYLVGWSAANYNAECDFKMFMEGFFSSLSVSFAIAAVFLTTTIPDAPGDRSIGKRTVTVLYGKKYTAVAAAVFCCLALVFSFFLKYNALVMIIPSGLSLPLFIAFVIFTKEEFVYKVFRLPVFILSLFVVIYVPLYGVVIIITLFLSRIYYKRRFNIAYPTLKSK